MLAGLAELSDKACWPETVARLRQLMCETDAISGNWLSHAQQLLHDCQVYLHHSKLLFSKVPRLDDLAADSHCQHGTGIRYNQPSGRVLWGGLICLNLGHVLSEEARNQLCQAVHCLVKGVEHAEQCVLHMVVTTGQLVPTLAKLLICDLDAYVPAENIYSARDETKDTCFRLIEDSYGPHTHYCVIGKSYTPCSNAAPPHRRSCSL